MTLKERISDAKTKLNKIAGHNERQNPNKQDLVTDKIGSQQRQDIDISEEDRDALKIERKNESHGVGTCPYCKNGQIKEETVSAELGQERGVSQTKGMGGTLSESKSDTASRSVEREMSVYSCNNGEQQCPQHIRPGDINRVGELKAEGLRPSETKMTYQEKLRQIENQSVSQNETQSRTQGL